MSNRVTSKKGSALKSQACLSVCLLVLLTNLNCFYPQFAQMKEGLAANNSQNEKGRSLILSGNISEAIASYATMAQNSTSTTLIAEYAYALALGGIYDAALINLDRIGNQTGESDVKYFTAQVFALMGYDDIATEFWKPSENSKIPAWIALNSAALLEKFKGKLPRTKKPSREELIAKFELANELVTDHLYIQSIALFHEIIDFLPDEYLPYAGYSVSLEKIGALEKSAQIIEKARTLVGDQPEDLGKKQFLENRLAAIKTIMESPPKVNSKFQKNVSDNKHPQMMAYGGGMIGASSTSLIFKIGRFISDQSNVSCNLGITSSPGGGASGNLGLSVYNRYRAYIYGIGLMTSGNNWSMVYSLGMELNLKFKKTKGPAFDKMQIFLDANQALSSGSSFSVNISLGLPLYFGTRK